VLCRLPDWYFECAAQTEGAEEEEEEEEEEERKMNQARSSNSHRTVPG